MAKGIRAPGEFCWVNVMTPKPAEARAFFAALLGWTYVEMPGLGGHRAQVDGRDFGAVFDMETPDMPPGTPPHVGVVLKVESADATVERVRALGGKAQPAFDIGTNGRMTVCEDPTGAHFDVWQPLEQPGMDADSDAHGAPGWFEEVTADPARAAKFYEALFGWTTSGVPMPFGEYTLCKRGEGLVAGIMPSLEEMGNPPPHWATYFTVRDADETAREAERLGGRVVVPPCDIEDVGRFAGLASPQGVMFYVMKYSKA